MPACFRASIHLTLTLELLFWVCAQSVEHLGNTEVLFHMHRDWLSYSVSSLHCISQALAERKWPLKQKGWMTHWAGTDTFHVFLGLLQQNIQVPHVRFQKTTPSPLCGPPVDLFSPSFERFGLQFLLKTCLSDWAQGQNAGTGEWEAQQNPLRCFCLSWGIDKWIYRKSKNKHIISFNVSMQ